WHLPFANPRTPSLSQSAFVRVRPRPVTSTVNGYQWLRCTLAARVMILVERSLVISCLPIPLPGTCTIQEADVERNESIAAAYLDNSGRDDVLGGGVKMIPVETPKGSFRVWTKRIGNHPTMKVLLLHGGPGATHEYLEAFDSYFPAAGIEYYYYDQL